MVVTLTFLGTTYLMAQIFVYLQTEIIKLEHHGQKIIIDSQAEEAPSYDDLEELSLNYNFFTDWNYDRFAVLLEKNEEIEARLKEEEKARERAEKLGPLEDELSTKQETLRRYQDAVKGIKENIAQFKELGMAQEIIDEETAKVASNKTRIKELKSVIASLKAEIQKVKD